MALEGTHPINVEGVTEEGDLLEETLEVGPLTTLVTEVCLVEGVDPHPLTMEEVETEIASMMEVTEVEWVAETTVD